MLAWLAGLFESVVQWVWVSVVTFLYWIRDGLLDILGQLAAWIISLLPAGVQTYLAGEPWTVFYPYMDQIDWFIPIYACMLIYGTAMALVAAIRLGRWLLALIPTVNLGG